MHEVIVAIRRQNPNDAITEALPGTEGTDLEAEADALSQDGFTTDTEVKGHRRMAAAGDAARGKEHVAV
jgi:hypothetical protein